MRYLIRLMSLLVLVFAAGVSVADMVPLSTEELVAITAQDGIAFEWDLRINSDINGNINTTICPPANRVQCRFAIKWANREEGGGEWTVYKGFSGRFYFPRFNLSAGTSPAGATTYAAASRFVDFFGAPVSPYNKVNLLLSFPEAIQIFNYRIAGIAIEYGTGLTAGTGFQADPTDANSFIGLAINNSIPGSPGTISVAGNLQIFGF